MPYNYGGYQQQYQPFGQQYNQQNNFGQKSNIDWIMVASVADVDRVQVQPGTKSWIMVQNEPIFALRAADNMGLATTELYRFERYEPKQEMGPESNYVTKEELEAALLELRNMIGENDDEPITQQNEPEQKPKRKPSGYSQHY